MKPNCENCVHRMQKVLTDSCKLLQWKTKSEEGSEANWCAFYEPIKENENESKNGSGQGNTSEN